MSQVTSNPACTPESDPPYPPRHLSLQPIRGAEYFRRGGYDWGLTAIVVLWILFVVTMFRLPTSPIVVSDENAGGAIRQLLFTGAAGLSIRRMAITGCLMATLMQHRVMLLLGFGLLATVAYSIDKTLTIKRSIIFNFGLIAIIGMCHVSNHPVRTMHRVLFGLCTAFAWIGIMQWFGLPKNTCSIEERPGLAGVTNHPNTMGITMAVGFICSLGIGKLEGFKMLFVRWAQFGMFLAMFLANSVTSIMTAMVTTGMWFFLMLNGYRKGAVLVVGVTLYAIVLAIGPSNIKSAAFAAAGRDESLSGRDVLWERVANEGMKTPLFGAGFSAFWYEGRGRELVYTWNPRQCHNSYIDLFVDLGFIGMALVLLLFVFTLWYGWQRYAGEVGSDQRKAVSAMVAGSIGLMTVYGFAESFILRIDKIPMFALLWWLVLLGNPDTNRIDVEFSDPKRVPL